MGLSLAEADALSLYDYEELLYHNNAAYETEERPEPQPDRAKKLIDSINANPLLTH